MAQSIIIIDPKTELLGKQHILSHVVQPQIVKKATKDIGIDQVRAAQKWMQSTGFEKGSRTIIIEQAQRLTTEAQQALLKTLEEPTSDTTIILLTNKLDALLPTILSRCARLNAPSLTSNQLDQWRLAKSRQKAAVEKGIAWQEFITQNQKQQALYCAKISSSKDKTLEQIQAWITHIEPTNAQDVRHLEILDRTAQKLTRYLNPRLCLLQMQAELSSQTY